VDAGPEAAYWAIAARVCGATGWTLAELEEHPSWFVFLVYEHVVQAMATSGLGMLFGAGAGGGSGVDHDGIPANTSPEVRARYEAEVAKQRAARPQIESPRIGTLEELGAMLKGEANG
jgi:hypothetical protein